MQSNHAKSSNNKPLANKHKLHYPILRLEPYKMNGNLASYDKEVHASLRRNVRSLSR